MPKPKVFISYSHRDAEWKDRFLEPLRALERNGHFHIWADTALDAGDDWRPRIRKAIEQSSAAILIVTNSFLSSEFIGDEEVPRILKKRRRDGLRVFPVIVRPCPWQDIAWLAKMQVRPEQGRPLVHGSDYDIEQDLADLARDVLRKLKTIEVRSKAPAHLKRVSSTGASRKKKSQGGPARITVVSLGAGLRKLSGWLERLTELQSYFAFDVSSKRLPVRSVGRIEGAMQLKVYRLSDSFQKAMVSKGDTAVIGLTRETLAFEEGEDVYYNYLGAPSAVEDRLGFLSVIHLAKHAKRAKVLKRTAFAYDIASQLAWQVGGLDYHDEVVGCPMDYTEDHGDIVKGLRRGEFCGKCTGRLQRHRRTKQKKELLVALQAILDYGRA